MKRQHKAVAISLVFLGVWAAGFSPAASAGAAVPAENQVRISGRVMDFKNQPIPGASVQLKDSHFKTVAEAVSAADGSYSLTAAKGNYMALLAVKDYQTKCLEFWAWNVPATEDLEIDPRFDRLEVYAINAWRPQGAYPSYQIYFRPMSLTKAGKKIAEAGGMEGFAKLPLADIAPDLTLKDIAVTIDGQAVNVLKINRVLEAAGPKQDMVAYVIQADLPKEKPSKNYCVITITLTDHETGEMGEGSLFLKSNR